MNTQVRGIATAYTNKILKEGIEPKIDPTGITDFLNNPTAVNALAVLAGVIFMPAKLVTPLTPFIKKMGIGALRKLATPENIEQIFLLARTGKLGPYVQNALKTLDEAGIQIKITPDKVEIAKKTLTDAAKKIEDTAKTITTPEAIKAEAQALSTKLAAPTTSMATSPGMTPLKPLVKPALPPAATGPVSTVAGKGIPPVLKPIISPATKQQANALKRAVIIKVISMAGTPVAIIAAITLAVWLELRKKRGPDIAKQEQNLRKGVIYTTAPDGSVQPLYAVLASGQLTPQQIQQAFNNSNINLQVGAPNWQISLNAAWNVPDPGSEKPYTAKTNYGEYKTFIGTKVHYASPGQGADYSYTVIYLQNTASEQQWFPFNETTQEVTITRPDGSYVFTDLSTALKNLNIVNLYAKPIKQKEEQEESKNVPSPIDNPAEFRAYLQTSFYDDFEIASPQTQSVVPQQSNTGTAALPITSVSNQFKTANIAGGSNIAGEIDRPMGGFDTPVDSAPSRPDTFINPPFTFDDLFTNPQERIQKLLNPQQQPVADIPSYSGSRQQSQYRPAHNYNKTSSGLNSFINMFVDDEDKDTF